MAVYAIIRTGGKQYRVETGDVVASSASRGRWARR